MKLVDLTHAINEKSPVWDLNCGFKTIMKVDYSDCTGDTKFRVQTLACPAGVGTHMDAPAHCIPGAQSIAEIPLEQLINSCVVIDVSKKVVESYAVQVDDIKMFEAKHGRIQENIFVIIYTGWSQYWKDPERYRNNLIFPSVSVEAAEFLLARGIVGLGIDTLSPDSGGEHFPVHQAVLGAGKYIIENIANANQLPPVGAQLIALPLKIEGGTESPLRLIGMYGLFS